ncbi:MAG: ABC transporter permease [Desulfobacteraceae bacterium]|jgi:peptide/nickel transport system permease protein
MKLAALKPIAGMLAKEMWRALLLLLGVSVVVFAVLSFAPGDPFGAMLSSFEATAIGPEAGAANKIQQYLAWLGQLIQGNFGHSIRSGRPVLNEVIRTSINTLYLTIGSMVLSLFLAVPVAVYTARRGIITTSGWAMTIITYVLSAIPAFWFGYIIIYIAIHRFGFFPLAGGAATGTWTWFYFLLPVLVLGLCSCGLSEMVRYLREELARVLDQDYVRTAKAKGVSVWRHAFKEGFLLPITEMVAARIPFILGGAVVVEQVFNWPGMGRMAWQAAQDRDFPLIMGITLVAALFVRLGSLLKQVVHIAVNPRASQKS